MLPQEKKALRLHARQNLIQGTGAVAAAKRLSGKASSASRNKMSSKADPVSLSYYDACLRMSDVQLLQGPHWLNDQIISFYYEYLTHGKYKTNSDFVFIPPEVTQCMKYMDDVELAMLMDQHGVKRKPFVFFAVNDNQTTEAGGTHWSLLVFSRPERTFFHFDSYGNNNTRSSMELMAKVKDELGERMTKFRPMRCLQQTNGYDCGIHVICMTDHIADFLNRYEVIEGLPTLHNDTVKAKRSDILKLIISLGGKV